MKTQLNKAIEALTKLRVKNVNNLPLEKQLYDVEMMLCKAVDDLEQATKTNVTDQQQLPANTKQIMKEFHKLFLDTVRQHRFIGMDTIWDFFKPYLESKCKINDDEIVWIKQNIENAKTWLDPIKNDAAIICLNNAFDYPNKSEKKELSEITDEDAIEVAKFFLTKNNSRQSAIEFGKSMVTDYSNDGHFSSSVIQVYKYLESKNYKLPNY